ncbi:MAG: VWA domain-containing protein [Bacteroidales bacterium]|nr:VWA domain-containing protein [Bacteroidales bacterium]
MNYKDINFNIDFGNFNPDDIQVDETINAVFIVDTSSSVQSYVNELNFAFNDFTESMQKSHIANKLMVSVIEFNSKVRVECGFRPISSFTKTDFSKKIGGMTALYDGVLLGLRNAIDYRQNLENSGIETKTILFVITDGGDNVSKNPAHMIAKEIADQKKDERSAFSFTSIMFGVGNDADFTQAQQEMGIEHLAKIGTTGSEMKKMIGFISQSISSMSVGKPNVPVF